MRKRYKGIEIENPLDELAFAQKTSERLEEDTPKWQYKALNFLIVLLLSVLFFRIFYLQIIQGEHYRVLANNNRIRKIVIKAPRGVIKDVNGEILARNIPSFELNFTPAYLPRDNKELEKMIKKISLITKENKDELIKKIYSQPVSSQRTYLLIEKLETNTALKLAEKSDEFPGIIISKTAKREYPKKEIIAHTLGYDGKVTKEDLEKYPNYLMIDYIGKGGVEEMYEKYLHGKHGEHRYEVNSRGKTVRDLGMIAPEPGYNLKLNIDIKLQEKIFSEAQKTMEKDNDATGVVVVAIDPRDGAIRALVNYPSFDNNLFSGGISNEEYQKIIANPNNPLLNRAVAGLYPPGSTYKPMVAAAALQEKVINEHTTVNCHGQISVGKWVFPDWKVHGITDIKKAIAQSCDVFFYAVGGGWDNIKGLQINRLNKYASFFGLGDYLGVDLPGEKKGTIPGNTWKFKTFGEKWYIGDTYHASIGQGYVTVTPLQIANVTAAIANGGKVYRPRIANELINPKTKERVKIKPDILNENFISPENIKIVQEGMRQTVIAGSGRRLNDLKVHTAGKTGTAQFGGEDKTHSWYVSYGPYENPELAMAVLVEGGGEGHTWAVPLTKEIYKWYFDEERGEKRARSGLQNDTLAPRSRLGEVGNVE